MRDTHRVKPKLSYSNCGMQNGYWKGWNIEFKKSDKEAGEAELLMPQCCDAMQNN